MDSVAFLVIGCAGFIGSSTAFELLQKVYKVREIDRFPDYYSRRLKEYNLSALKEFKHSRA